jgi:hypothetical protein
VSDREVELTLSAAGAHTTCDVIKTGFRSVSARQAVVILAEREVTDLAQHIAQLETRMGMLRHQRENLMSWILRQAKARGGNAVGRSDVRSEGVGGSRA